jgi:serine/threonine-protein kinase
MEDKARLRNLLDQLLTSETTPEAVCRTCPEMYPTVRLHWRRLRQLQAELDILFPPARETGPLAPPDEEITLPKIDGYEVENVLGRGGMGVVFRARHLRLNRVVALKMALSGAYAGRHERERFQQEAEVVAGLRHPNIVQIHDIGDSEGRLYFTMEIVEGGSLAQKLAGTPQPASQAAQVLLILAGAVQAAHQGGILHRDLKPSNILLAADGIPKISDFGLARRLDNEPGLTRTGMPVGTPGYMAPEQAAGRPVAPGPAVDIYALGAILYELLTGRPPFRAETAAATLQQVISDDPAPPSRLNARIPRDLETICLKCLRKEPEKRYASARELADDLGRFQRGEPIAARPVSHAELMLRWIRRRPAVAGLVLATSLLLTSGIVFSWLHYQRAAADRSRQAQTDQEVRGMLERASTKLADGWETADLAVLRDAANEGNRAADVSRSGGASRGVQIAVTQLQAKVAERLARSQKNRDLLDALLDVSAPAQLTSLPRASAGRSEGLAQVDVNEQYEAAFRAWGLDIKATSEADIVARLAAEPAVVTLEVIVALDNWVMEHQKQHRPESDWRKLLQVTKQLGGGARYRRLRSVLFESTPNRAAGAASIVGLAASPWSGLAALTMANGRLQLLIALAEIDPRTEPVLTVVLLAGAFAATGDEARAEQILIQALTARPDHVVLLGHLGKLLEKQGPSRMGEAIGYFQAARGQRRQLGLSLGRALMRAGRAAQAEEIMQELVAQKSDEPMHWFNLGLVLNAQQKYAHAATAYRKAFELAPAFAEAYYNYGIVMENQGKTIEAEKAYRNAIELKPAFAEALTNLGKMLFLQKKVRDAEAMFRLAIAANPQLPNPYLNLGIVQNSRREYAQGEASFRQAIKIQPDIAEAHCNLANVLLLRLDPVAAEAASRKAIELNPRLAEAYLQLGNALEEQGKHTEAEQMIRKSLELQPGEVWTYYHLGVTLIRQKKHRDAELVFRRCLELQPNLAEAHSKLANTLINQWRFLPAEDSIRRALALKPDLYEAHYNLGILMSISGQLDQAELAFRKAARLEPNVVEAQQKLINTLFQQGRHCEAEPPCRNLVQLKPDQAEAFVDLATALFAIGKLSEAETALRRALVIKPGLARAHTDLGSVLNRLERYPESEAAHRKAIELDPQYPDAHHNLGLVLVKQLRFEEAAGAFRKAAMQFPFLSPRRLKARNLEKACNRYVDLNPRFSTLLQGTVKVGSPTEQLDLARLCQLKKLYAAAADHYRLAFEADPKLCANTPDSTRYDAACAAILASAGRGVDAAKTDDKKRQILLEQGLDWLQQDLAYWGVLLDRGSLQDEARVRSWMHAWQNDPDLSSIRSANARSRLHPAERSQCDKLWTAVDALLARANRPKLARAATTTR